MATTSTQIRADNLPRSVPCTESGATRDAAARFDIVIVGSGGGAVTAALVAKARGLRPVIIEKRDKFGGSTAYSGGVLWLPLNPYRRVTDTPEKALRYFAATTGEVGPASSDERKQAFVENSPKMAEFLVEQGMQFEHAEWPDYYSDEPGGMAEGRSLIAPFFDLRRLGGWHDKIGYSPFTTAQRRVRKEVV